MPLSTIQWLWVLLVFDHGVCQSAGLLEENDCLVLGCCEDDCCGVGTSWDIRALQCVPAPGSPGYDGIPLPGYQSGCALRSCCEVNCCGDGTFYNTDIECCMPAAAPTECTVLSENTTQALTNVLMEANGAEIILCSTAITFAQPLSLDVPVNLVCDGTCIFDGNNSTRLFNFGDHVFPNAYPIDYQVSFNGFVFQRGQAVDPTFNGGGLFLFVGTPFATARFEDCQFLDSYAVSNNGGAVLGLEAGNFDFVGCLFRNNYSYNGGAISVIDVKVTVESTSFLNNTAIGGAEGAAIYAGSNDPLNDNMGIVKCIGDSNVFEGNAFLPDIVGLVVEGCDNVADVN